MLSTCCRCVLACSVAASLAAIPAQAQDLGSSITEQATAPAAQQSPFPSKQKSFFGSLFDDFRAIPTRDNLIIAGVGGLAASMVHPADATCRERCRARRAWAPCSRPATPLAARRYRWRPPSALRPSAARPGVPGFPPLAPTSFASQIVAQTVTQGIKLAVGRTRPDGTQFSFPSGHSASSFATATVLQRHLGWKAGVPAYALATFVAASRVQVKRHYLSDVTMGAAIGIIAGRAVTVGRGDARFAVAPSAVPGGAGVNFTWVGRQ